MSRVPCIDCGVPVVVDPSGLCPDGHFVGTDGARIEAAIGVAVPHPDEPEPWVAQVVLDPQVHADTAPPGGARAPRPPSAPDEAVARPNTPASVPAGGNGPTPTTTRTDPLSASDTDDLMRELHSLSDGPDAVPSPPHVQVPPRPAAPAPPTTPIFSPRAASPQPATAAPHPAPEPPAPTTPPPAPEPEATAGSSPAPDPTPDVLPRPEASAEATHAHHDGLAELRALEAAVNALTSGEDPDSLAGFADPPRAAPPAAPADADGVVTRLPTPAERNQDTPDRDQLAEVEELFARRPRPLTEEGAQPRPSQAGPPPEPPRPAFERTPWSSLPVEDVDAAPSPASSPSPTDRSGTAAASDAAARTRRSPSAQPSTGDDALDLGNFTARGGRVGRAEAKRRKWSR